MKLCLVHTADFHDRLTAAKAARLREVKSERQALLLDCGDAIAAPNVVAFPWPERAVRLMNLAGYDAMAMGNREYCWCRDGLRRKTHEAQFPVLAANLAGRGRDLGRTQRWVTLVAPGGARVGLFGLTQVMIRPGSLAAGLAASSFTDQIPAAREAVVALRGEVDVLIALTHYGRGDEDDLARACPELDAILCGHWHVPRPSLEMVGRVAVARTFHHGRGAAILTLEDGGWRQEEFPL
jgi:5'-nucleotidase / UDP-sugar diphosphatase